MKTRPLYRIFLAGALSLLAATGAAAAPDDYPARPVKVVVPFTPGGAADVVARTAGEQLSRRLGQPVIVENRPGASGAIAAEYVARSAADGYTLLVADLGQLAINPAMNSKLRYAPERDLRPIGSVASVPLFVAVNPRLPIASTRDLIAHAKRHPGLTYGTVGVGTPHHLAMEMFAARAGLHMTHVPFKGSPEILPALVSGDIAVTISALAPLLPHAQAGKIRIIAVATEQRSGLAPEVPAIAEELPGYAMGDLIGLLAPAGTPDGIAGRLARELSIAARSPDVAQRLANLGLDSAVLDPQAYGARIRQAAATYARLIKELGISAE